MLPSVHSEKLWRSLLKSVTPSELDRLASYLQSLNGETRVILEHTGRYYEPVARKLNEAGIFVSAINPKPIKNYGLIIRVLWWLLQASNRAQTGPEVMKPKACQPLSTAHRGCEGHCFW